MSKHNYSQYSKKQPQDQINKVETVEKISAEEIEPIVATPEVKMEPVAPVAPVITEIPAAPVVPMVETVDTVALPKFVEGVVVNCAKLNVREEPTTDSDIVCVLPAMSEIEIDVTKSTKEWFKVCTAIGVEGYCMRKFVDSRL